MNVITFEVCNESCDQVPSNAIIVGDHFLSECGIYTVRELTAQEGIDALNELIAENAKLQENPDQISAREYKVKLLEKATTFNKEPFKLDFNKIPHKLYSLLLAANEKLNSLSDEEASFLLKPSSSKEQPSTQQ